MTQEEKLTKIKEIHSGAYITNGELHLIELSQVDFDVISKIWGGGVIYVKKIIGTFYG